LSAQETTDGALRARAGALTLLFITASVSREVLLELLAKARSGGALGPPDPDAYAAREEEERREYELEAEIEAAEDEGLEDIDVDIDIDPSAIGPDTLMRATPAGTEFLFVAFTLQRWLRNSPQGPLEIGMPGAGDAMAALVCCWSGTVVHGLASGPRTIAELHEIVDLLDRATLEEHVAALERTGQVEALPGRRGQTRYAVTEWMREGFAPIAAAARMERHHPHDDVLPPDRLDAEAAFQLALPLIELPADLSGSCRLGVRLSGDGSAPLAGVTAQVEGGRVVSCESRLDERAGTWATGSPIEWLDTAVDPSAALLDAGGDMRLAGAVVEGIYDSLFGIPVR
jgi:DNA-binding HxlR family transcriptional regulator